MVEYNLTATSLTTKREFPIIVKADEAETTDDIVLSVYIDDVNISASNYGYFSAFQEIRDKLLQIGYGIKCAESKLNAVQSAMASATNKVYLTDLGKQAMSKDLICFFDYADINEFPDTKEQSDYSGKWIKSLR